MDDDRREKGCWGRDDEEAHQIELPRGVNEGHQNRQDSPGDENARDPAARAPALGNQGARNFQQEITNKENSRSETNDMVAEAQVVRHLERRGADVHAIHKRDDVEQEKKRQEPPCDAAPGALCYVRDRSGSCHGGLILRKRTAMYSSRFSIFL